MKKYMFVLFIFLSFSVFAQDKKDDDNDDSEKGDLNLDSYVGFGASLSGLSVTKDKSDLVVGSNDNFIWGIDYMIGTQYKFIDTWGFSLGVGGEFFGSANFRRLKNDKDSTQSSGYWQQYYDYWGTDWQWVGGSSKETLTSLTFIEQSFGLRATTSLGFFNDFFKLTAFVGYRMIIGINVINKEIRETDSYGLSTLKKESEVTVNNRIKSRFDIGLRAQIYYFYLDYTYKASFESNKLIVNSQDGSVLGLGLIFNF